MRFGGASSSRSLPLRRGGGDKESQPRRTVKQILQRMGSRRVSTTKNNSSSKLRASQTSRTSTLSSALQPTGSSGALTALPRMETIPSDSTRETERESGLSELTERELSDLQSFRSGPSERSMDSAALERGATAAEEDGGGRLRFEEDEDDEDELEDDVELFPRFPDPQDGTVDRIREWVDRRAVQIETAKLKQQINMLRTGMLRPLVPSDKGYLDETASAVAVDPRRLEALLSARGAGGALMEGDVLQQTKHAGLGANQGRGAAGLGLSGSQSAQGPTPISPRLPQLQGSRGGGGVLGLDSEPAAFLDLAEEMSTPQGRSFSRTKRIYRPIGEQFFGRSAFDLH